MTTPRQSFDPPIDDPAAQPDHVADALPPAIDRLDQRIVATMRRLGAPALRITLAIVFIWFGLLKPLGFSPAADLVEATVRWMPIFSAPQWRSIIGWWEVAIGVLFLFRGTIRIAIALLALQMVGAFMPLVVLPSVTFQPGRIPWAPTMEGQYIIKNLVIIAAAIAIGGTARGSSRREHAVRS